MADNLTRLETVLKRVAKSKRNSFPPPNDDYFQVYRGIRQRCENDFFCESEMQLVAEQVEQGKHGAWFTRHGLDHALDVQEKIALLLGEHLEKYCQPYEIFVLATASMLHDAGLYAGREGHEKTAAELAEHLVREAGLDEIVGRDIGDVVRAHTGELEDGNKNVIMRISEDGGTKESPLGRRALAALLRLADELSDNRERARASVLENPNSPAFLAHLFCAMSAIRSGIPASIEFYVKVRPEDMERAKPHPYESDGKEIYFLDFVAERIVKLDREWRYCSQFLFPLLLMSGSKADLPLRKLQINLDFNDFHAGTRSITYPRFEYPPEEGIDALLKKGGGFPCAERLHTLAIKHSRETQDE